MKRLTLLAVVVFSLVVVSCEKEEETIYKDGTYKAEEASYHYGWKGFLEVTIKDDKFTAVDYDALNADNVRKSETTSETYPMTPHPSVWMPELEARLLATKITPSLTEVDKVSGATSGSGMINTMAAAILDAAKTGNTATIIIGTAK